MKDLTTRTKRILIVDDSRAVLRNLREILSAQAGWVVCGEAENGREAIEKAAELHPDVIILDLSMPVMNGLDAGREIRKLLPLAQIFLFSAFHTENLEAIARSAGIDAYIAKSDVQTLLARLGQLAAA